MKINPNFRITIVRMGVISLAFILLGCGGKNGGSSITANPPPVSGPTITGTAATGRPIKNALVTLKDQNGNSKTGTTDDNGKYSIAVTGMTPPFLLKLVDSASGTTLYSVGLQQAGNVNIHPYTNLMIGILYQLKVSNVENAFETMGSSTTDPVPSALEVSTLSRITNHILHIWITNQGLAPKSFDFITTPFDANDSGFDGVLALSKIDSNGTVTIQDSNTIQTSTLPLDPSTSTVTVNTMATTTDDQLKDNTITSFVIPNTEPLQTALNGVNATLMNVVATANSKGGSLADKDLSGYFDDNYLQDGTRKDVGAAELATLLQGVAQNLQSFMVYRIVSYDNNVIQVVGMFSWTQNGQNLLRMVNKGVGGLYFRLQADTSWRIIGNQQIASVGAQAITVNTMSGDSPDGVVAQNYQLQVTAPQGTITGVNATVDTTDYQLTKWSTVLVDTITPVPKDVFTNVPVVTQIPPLGTSASFTLNPPSGPIYADTFDAATTEWIQITNLPGYTLDDAMLGQTLTVEWTLPTSFPIGRVELAGLVTAGGSSCKVYSQVLGTSAVNGTIILPSTCNGYSVVPKGDSTGPDPAVIQVTVWGLSEEQTQVQYHFK